MISMTRSDKLTKLEQMLNNRCTPEIITELKEDEVFVFGSKPDGNHKSGAAKIAVEKFGAQQGLGEGFSVQSYAIPVHKCHTHKMDKAVKTFIGYAKKHSDKAFYVLPVGCGSAGIDIRIVSEMFSKAMDFDNIFLPKQFIITLINNRRTNSSIQYTNYPNMFVLRQKWSKKFSRLINSASGKHPVLGNVTVEMDCSISEATELVIDLCLPLLSTFYPELRYRISSTTESFWLKPDLTDASLAINQITEGWYQCLGELLGYHWYVPHMKREDIISCLTYPLCLYGPYFDEFDY